MAFPLKLHLSTNKYKVIILFAHWTGFAVELFDGFCTPNDALAIFPESREVIIDLNICNCKAFLDTVAPVREKCLIKRNERDKPCYLGAWFLFFASFFKLITDYNLT